MGRLCGFFAFGEESPVPSSGRPEGPAGFAGPRAIAAFPGDPAAGDEAASAEAPEEESTLPPLPDAAARAAEARRRFETDREGAIADLQALREQHAPSPPILHALALMLHAAGRSEAGATVARDAIALGLRRGQASLAAEVFAAYWKQSNALGVSGGQVNVLATTLFKSGHVAQATTAFGVALNLDHGDRRAIQGLLQIADHRLHREAKPKDAARIYTFLLQYAASTSFAEDMKRGLAEAEGRLKRAV